MTDNNATQPARKVGPIRQWIKDHPNIWEFILFNLLSRYILSRINLRAA